MDSPVIVKEAPLPVFSTSERVSSIVMDFKKEDDDIKPSLDSLAIPLPPRSSSRSASPASLTSHPEDLSTSPPSASSSSRSPPSESTPKPPKPKATRKPKVKLEESIPHDMSHLPLADEEASKTYVKMVTNHHQFNTLGRSHQDEDAMVCDCQFRPDRDEPNMACGEGSGCINRLTQVECLESECRSSEHCQNQRFNRKEYANIEVVQTERKGFGLRAAEDIESDAFIYEYIGEVVQQSTFMKRMREYAESGIRHFYFMMLQKEEYLDATKKGGIGRFANHSCNPNCYVAKWVVGKRMRMGIFAKRDIVKGEELTFNYNVDRYGHDAQPCYCDEPNCVGSIGGKTQTDVGGMDDLYLDALGIADEVELLGLKGNKKRKGKKLGVDFMPILKPIQEHEVPKLIAAVRQSTSNRPMLTKLLSRVKMTNDEAVQRQVMRMHGFNLMGNVLRDFGDDADVVKLVIETMSAWPMQTRNKIVDSKIEESINTAVEKEQNQDARQPAQQLLESWNKLPTAYRIAKRPVRIPDAGDDNPTGSASPAVGSSSSLPPPTSAHETHNPFAFPPPPIASTSSAATSFYASLVPSILRSSDSSRTSVPESEPSQAEKPAPDLQGFLTKLRADRDAKEKERLAAEAAAATTAAAEAAARVARAESSKKRKKISLGGSILSRSANASSSSLASSSTGTPGRGSSSTSRADLEAQKEKRLTKMIGDVVVRSMSKYKEQIGESERFKGFAKECTSLIVAKEKHSSTFLALSTVPPPLSEEKQTKMKKFTKDYVHRVLKKGSSSSSHRNGSSSSHRLANGQASSSTTPASATPNDSTPDDYDAGEQNPTTPMDVDEDARGKGVNHGVTEARGDASTNGYHQPEDEREDEGGGEDGRRGMKDRRLEEVVGS